MRLDRKRFTSKHFHTANSAGNRISFDSETGTFWFEDYFGDAWGTSEKFRIHSRNAPAIEWADGVQAWVQKGLYHRKDGPALVYNGLENRKDRYFVNGIELTKEVFDSANRAGVVPYDDGTRLMWLMESTSLPHCHNDDPAVEYENGMKEWHWRGKLHRRNAPAKIWPDGSYAYYEFGTLHRLDGPASEGMNGTQGWFKNGILHRDPRDGPAVTHEDGGQEYRVEGKKHNPYGPAVIYPDGEVEFWLDGIKVTEEDVLGSRDELISSLMEETRAAMNKTLESYVGAPLSPEQERGLKRIVELELLQFISKAEQVKQNLGLDIEEELAEIQKETEQLELSLDPTNEKPESSSESSEEEDQGPGWKLTVGALLVAAGMKGFSTLTNSEQDALEEAAEIAQEYTCQ